MFRESLVIVTKTTAAVLNCVCCTFRSGPRSTGSVHSKATAVISSREGPIWSTCTETRDSYALCDGYIPTIHARPPVGVTGYRHDDGSRVYPIGYHPTYWSNFANIVCAGLVPGGVTLGGSSGRAFTCLPGPAPQMPAYARVLKLSLPLTCSSRAWKGVASSSRRTIKPLIGCPTAT